MRIDVDVAGGLYNLLSKTAMPNPRPSRRFCAAQLRFLLS